MLETISRNLDVSPIDISMCTYARSLVLPLVFLPLILVFSTGCFLNSAIQSTLEGSKSTDSSTPNTSIAVQVHENGTSDGLLLKISSALSGNCSDFTYELESSNTLLVSQSEFSVTGQAPDCVGKITPKPQAHGDCTVQIFVIHPTTSKVLQSARFTVSVIPVNDPPTLANISNATTNANTAVVVNLASNDLDNTIACNSTSFQVTSSNTVLFPSSAIVVDGAFPNCTLTLTPSAGLSGLSTIQVKVKDNELFVQPYSQEATRSFVVTVNPVVVNNAPVGVADNFMVLAGGSFDIDVLANDTDSDGDSLSIFSSAGATKGSTSTVSGKIRYAANAGMYGTDSFTYIAKDPSGASTGSITVSVKVMNPYTWTNSTLSGVWTTPANWCGSINAAGTACLGQTVPPGVTSSVVFDETCTVPSCSTQLPAGVTSLTNLTLSAGYTGTISANAMASGSGLNIAGNLNFFGGTLTIGNGMGSRNIVVGGTMTYGGGTFVDNGCGEGLIYPSHCFKPQNLIVKASTTMFNGRAASMTNFTLDPGVSINTGMAVFYVQSSATIGAGATMTTGYDSTDPCFIHGTLTNSGTIINNGNTCPLGP